MSTDLLERAAGALGPLVGDVVFVGGATLGLWITDAGAAPIRPTLDVDAVVEIASRAELHEFDAALRARDFREDRESGVICRWKHGDPGDELTLDVMPTDAALLGFSNAWQAEAYRQAVRRVLSAGTEVRVAPPAHLIATKLEAFSGRGSGDYLLSHDLEDVIALVDGRATIVDEIVAADRGVRDYLAANVGSLLAEPRFLDAISGHLRPDAASQARRQLVVLPRLAQIAGLGGR